MQQKLVSSGEQQEGVSVQKENFLKKTSDPVGEDTCPVDFLMCVQVF